MYSFIFETSKIHWTNFNCTAIKKKTKQIVMNNNYIFIRPNFKRFQNLIMNENNMGMNHQIPDNTSQQS